jgi:hypothetical protein
VTTVGRRDAVKRSQLKRKTQLRRTKQLDSRSELTRRIPLRATSASALERGGWTKVPERTRIQRRIQEGVRRRVFARDGDRCVVRAGAGCTGRAEHAHHVILRSRGGPDEDWNEVSVCHWCHRFLHDHPAWATEHGWIKSREVHDPATGVG